MNGGEEGRDERRRDGLSEEERNERLTQAMERWWQYEAGT